MLNQFFIVIITTDNWLAIIPPAVTVMICYIPGDILEIATTVQLFDLPMQWDRTSIAVFCMFTIMVGLCNSLLYINT